MDGVKKDHVYEVERIANPDPAEQKLVYANTMLPGTLPNAGTKTIAHGIPNFKHLYKIYGFTTNGTTELPLPFISPTGVTNNIGLWADATNIYIQTGIDRRSFNVGLIWIMYTLTNQ